MEFTRLAVDLNVLFFGLKLSETHCTAWKISWESRRALSVVEDHAAHNNCMRAGERSSNLLVRLSCFCTVSINCRAEFPYSTLCVCSSASEADPVNEGYKHGTWRYSSTHLAFVTKMKKVSGCPPNRSCLLLVTLLQYFIRFVNMTRMLHSIMFGERR
jgi:hypothetical protein